MAGLGGKSCRTVLTSFPKATVPRLEAGTPHPACGHNQSAVNNRASLHSNEKNGRAGETRTHDPLHPMQVRYQAAPRPEPRTRKEEACARMMQGYSLKWRTRNRSALRRLVSEDDLGNGRACEIYRLERLKLNFGRERSCEREVRPLAHSTGSGPRARPRGWRSRLHFL